MRIYLDHNATTPLREEVVEAMYRALCDLYGNPSSTHEEGKRARAALDRARAQVAACLGTSPEAILFTSGATEANNTVLLGLAGVEPGWRIVTSRVEHPSVVAPCAELEASGVEVVRLEVDADGILDLAALDRVLGEGPDRPTLVTLIWANNETGVVQPMDEVLRLVRARGAALHVDATQAIGKWPVDLSVTPVDYLSCSAHKFNGPKGVGCLVVRGASAPAALLRGGPQERRARGGTENLAGIVGLGVACELARAELPERIEAYRALRDRLWDGIAARIPGVRRNGHPAAVLPNTLNVEFEGTAGEVLLQALDLEGVAISAGAACHSGSITPSHVLSAMGRTPEQARGCLRLSVGHGVTSEQIDRTLELLEVLVPRARQAVGA